MVVDVVYSAEHKAVIASFRRDKRGASSGRAIRCSFGRVVVGWPPLYTVEPRNTHLVTGGHAAELFEQVDEVLHAITISIPLLEEAKEETKRVAKEWLTGMGLWMICLCRMGGGRAAPQRGRDRNMQEGDNLRTQPLRLRHALARLSDRASNKVGGSRSGNTRTSSESEAAP